MKLLNGQDVADYIKGRHAGRVRAFDVPPKLSVVRGRSGEAAEYLRMLERYGEDIGVTVDAHEAGAGGSLPRLEELVAEATPTAVFWLLAAYNVALAGRIIAVVGQERSAGKLLTAELETAGHEVLRLDASAADLAARLLTADVVVSAAGRPGLITSSVIKPGAVVVDTGLSGSDLAADVRERTDLTIAPALGGVGPMVVAVIFDELLVGAQN